MRRLVTALSGALVLVAAAMGSASASPITHGAVVSSNPADFTPHVIANTAGDKLAVYKMAQVGGTMFAGGAFTQIQDSRRTVTYDRSNLFSFDPLTGTVLPLSVALDGPVWAIASSGSSLYVGGTFGVVNGVARKGLVKIDAVTGAVDPAFDARLNGSVREAQVVAGRLIIGGEFGKRLQAVDLTTGADTGYLDLAITGDVDGAGGWAPRVYRFAVDPAGTRLVAVGNFLTVEGQSRARAFMVDLGATSGELSGWYYQPFERVCRHKTVLDYLRDVDFSPDGSWFVIVSSGYVPLLDEEIGTSVCDAAARFETAELAPTAPTWINYTGGDTLQSTVVTKAAVYVQGHNRYLNNPNGHGLICNEPCVSRQGIGAIDPRTGLALPWNPSKNRGEGGKDLLLTAQGLWVASDTTVIGGETHDRVALMPTIVLSPRG